MKNLFKYISLFIITLVMSSATASADYKKSLVAYLAGDFTTAMSADYKKGLVAYFAGDFTTAMKEWRPLADQGNDQAQYELGHLYFYGLGVPQNLIESTKWHRLAADQGFADSQHVLGSIYAMGLGVSQNYVEAVKWWDLAFFEGRVNPELSLKALISGANLGKIANAQFIVGLTYCIGLGIPQDAVEAEKWFHLAADQGNADAQSFLNIMNDVDLTFPTYMLVISKEQGCLSAYNALYSDKYKLKVSTYYELKEAKNSYKEAEEELLEVMIEGVNNISKLLHQ
ncbi:sel1 repeat family protein [Emcibacteraceae bacterium]|nr:sel1 repeat family protein [Emcibacteraceae bacterium]